MQKKLKISNFYWLPIGDNHLLTPKFDGQRLGVATEAKKKMKDDEGFNFMDLIVLGILWDIRATIICYH